MSPSRTNPEEYRWTDDFADVFPEMGELNYALIDIFGIIRYHSPGLSTIICAAPYSLAGTHADQHLLEFSLPLTPRGACDMRLKNPNGSGSLKAFWTRTRAGFLYLFINKEPFLMEQAPRGVLSVPQTQDLFHVLRTTNMTIQMVAHEMAPPKGAARNENHQALLRECMAQERIFAAIGAMTRYSQFKAILKFNSYLHKIFAEIGFMLGERDISFTFRSAPSLPVIYCDPKRVEQCLRQLILLACCDREARALHVDISLSENKRMLYFEIRVQPPRVHVPCAEKFSLDFIHQVLAEHSGQLETFSDGFLMKIQVIPESYNPNIELECDFE
ncbi:MAG: hypothetical protein LBM75_10080 [Myxococcales bacterium]|jgi:hypothetical protein|nr:hypothetical protein [Myxococcales bacterium]